MPRLLGFTPTRQMLLEEAQALAERKRLIVENVIHDGPIMETNVEPAVLLEIPTYTPPAITKLPQTIQSKKKPSSELKRKVGLNPLSN